MQPDLIPSYSSNEIWLTLIWPGIAAIITMTTSTVIFLEYYPVSNTQTLDYIQIFFISLISTLSAALIYFNLGLLNVFAASYLISKSFLDFWPDYF